MLFGKKKLVGLDIGTHSIKLAEVSVSPRKVTLDGFSMVNTPQGVIQTSGVIEGSAMIAQSIKQALVDLKTRRKLAASGLWGASVVVKRIKMPRMEEGLIGEQLRWEAEQYIPYDIKDVNLDYKILETEAGDDSENMDVLLVAAKREAVFGVAESVEQSGLTCSTVDIDGFALANCFEQSYGDAEDGLVALFDIGAVVTNIVMLQHGEIVFCRDVHVGGETYTTALHRSMNISEQEAEQIKVGASQGDPTPDEAVAIIKSTHEVVLEELRSAMEFFVNVSTGQMPSVTQYYVSGGGSRTLGLEDCLREVYGVLRMDALAGIQYNSKKIPSAMVDQIRDLGSVAIGLGLREPGDS